jgi:hypothetical protein
VKRQAYLRLARRAVIDAEGLSTEERIQLFEDVALLLPKDEAQAAKDTAFGLRTAQKLQADFLGILKIPATQEPA